MVWPYGEHSTVFTKVQVREDRVSKFGLAQVREDRVSKIGLAIRRTQYCMYKSKC